MPKPRKNESKQDYLKRCTGELTSVEGRESDQAFAMCNAYWDDAHARKAERKPITLSGLVTFTAPEAGASDNADRQREFLMTAYTGEVIDLGFFGRYAFDVDGMRAKAKIPILREHQRDRVVGWSEKSWAEEHNFLIRGQFSQTTADALDVRQLADEGFPWQCSVGIKPRKIKQLKDKETMELNGATVTGPLEVWTQSEVGEVSFVSLGADSETAAIALTEPGGMITCDLVAEPEEVIMTLTELKEKYPDLYQELFALGAQSVDIEAARNEGMSSERERVRSLMSVEGADPDARQQAINEGLSLEAAYKLFFEASRAMKAAALSEMKAQAPESLGYQPPVEPERVDDANVEDVVAQKALQLSQAEGIDLALATTRVLKENKDLSARYYKRFDA